jgi:hypothetical protein
MSTIISPDAKGKPVLPRVKQPSRKRTKAWRKNIDITLEEHVLDEAREQERLGYIALSYILVL